MAYHELIKNFNKIRDYMRDFYVYGFKSRDEYTKKSARSYDDVRRRIESWLGDYMRFHQTADGKSVFLSIDSRVSRNNPLYKAWKTKSFTDGDITLHFILMDILQDETEKTLVEIEEELHAYLDVFDTPRYFDTSTIRKKLNEYVKEGIVVSRKEGRVVYYQRSTDNTLPARDLLHFYAETAPCGVIGSYLLDKTEAENDYFAFKHHYITSTIDSEILCAIFDAMHEERSVLIEIIHRHTNRIYENEVIPLRIMISVQSGRQYLLAYVPKIHHITSYRVDNILSVKQKDIVENYEAYRDKLEHMKPHMWGVGTSNHHRQLEHVEFTIHYTDQEQHIPRRLEREKRIGTVEHIDSHTSRFMADVYDAWELIPWIRTFICRITDISISNKEVEKKFRDDLEAMYAMYEIEEGDEDVI